MLKRAPTFIIGTLLLLAGATCGQVSQQSPNPDRSDEPAAAPVQSRAVAVTIYDLPATALAEGQNCDRAFLVRINRLLLQKLAAYDVPAVGFVNEGRICEALGEEVLREILLMWLNAGLELGNHTFAHHSLQDTPLEEYEADVIRGEEVTAELLRGRGQQLRYFRHPYLRTGPDDETKVAFEQFLSARGYTVAPVTIDNDEWIYAGAFQGRWPTATPPH